MTVCMDLASGSYVSISFATLPASWIIFIGVQRIVLSSIVLLAQVSCECFALSTPLGVGSYGHVFHVMYGHGPLVSHGFPRISHGFPWVSQGFP